MTYSFHDRVTQRVYHMDQKDIPVAKELVWDFADLGSMPSSDTDFL